MEYILIHTNLTLSKTNCNYKLCKKYSQRFIIEPAEKNPIHDDIRTAISRRIITSGSQKNDVIHYYFWKHTDISVQLQMAFTITMQKAKMNHSLNYPSIIL